MSTKGQEPLRRMSKTPASIEITESSKITCSREAFLANIDNKDRLIKLLCTRLEKERFVAVQSNGDADISIVKTVLEYAETGRYVSVMEEGTDILVLMMSHWRDGLGESFFGTEKKEKKRRHSKLLYWSMRDLLSTQQYQEALLSAHAWSGCDTTSVMHQKGKLKILKQLESREGTQWKHLDLCCLNPQDWGWKMEDVFGALDTYKHHTAERRDNKLTKIFWHKKPPWFYPDCPVGPFSVCPFTNSVVCRDTNSIFLVAIQIKESVFKKGASVCDGHISHCLCSIWVKQLHKIIGYS
eukprot:gene16687-8133_t